MDNATSIQQEKSQIFAEKNLYEMAEKGNYDHKIDYQKGKDALLKKREYMPENDRLSKNESIFLAKYYPELIERFSSQFNWREASSTVVQWAGKENIKKYFDRLDLYKSLDSFKAFEPELFQGLKKEIFRQTPVSYDKEIPKTHLETILKHLKEKGFNGKDSIIRDVENLKISDAPVNGKILLETLAKMKGEEKRGFMEGVEFNFNKAINIIKAAGLYLDENSITDIKLNERQSLKFPLFSKDFQELRDNLELLIKGQLTGLISGFKTKDLEFDAKMKLEKNLQTGKLQLRHHRKAKSLEIPEELSEQEISKLKNGEMLVLSRGFLFNYRFAKDKSALFLRNKISQIKKSAAKLNQTKTTMILDKELNKVIINYVIKPITENKKTKSKSASITANGDENPSIKLSEFASESIKGERKQDDKLLKVVQAAVNEIKKEHQLDKLEIETRKELGLDSKSKSGQVKNVQPKIKH